MRLTRLKLSRFYCLDRESSNAGSTLFVAGMGRSGTTWVSEVLNCRHDYRDIFEPFHPHCHRAARCFRYHHYMAEAGGSDIQCASARRILAGHTQSLWTAKHNLLLVAKQRIVKDIRANLMLHWLKELRPDMPLILLMRDPVDVYRSWRRLGWGRADGGEQSDLAAILAQRALLDDFPLIAEVADEIDSDDPVQVFSLLWCILYYVPLRKLAPQDYKLCRFEHLQQAPVEAFGELFRYLGLDLSPGEIERAAAMPSATSVSQHHAPGESGEHTDSQWRNKMAGLLKQFELDQFYPPSTPRQGEAAS